MLKPAIKPAWSRAALVIPIPLTAPP